MHLIWTILYTPGRLPNCLKFVITTLNVITSLCFVAAPQATAPHPLQKQGGRWSGQERGETCTILVTFSRSRYGNYFLKNAPEVILYTFGGEPGKVPIHISTTPAVCGTGTKALDHPAVICSNRSWNTLNYYLLVVVILVLDSFTS